MYVIGKIVTNLRSDNSVRETIHLQETNFVILNVVFNQKYRMSLKKIIKCLTMNPKLKGVTEKCIFFEIHPLYILPFYTFADNGILRESLLALFSTLKLQNKMESSAKAREAIKSKISEKLKGGFFFKTREREIIL